MKFISDTVIYLLLPCILFLGLFLLVMIYIQNRILNYLSQADFQVKEIQGLFFIENKNNRYSDSLSNHIKLKSISNEFNAIKKYKLTQFFNKQFDTKFNVFIKDYWLDERLIFMSDKRENVQMEIDHIKRLLIQANLKNEKTN